MYISFRTTCSNPGAQPPRPFRGIGGERSQSPTRHAWNTPVTPGTFGASTRDHARHARRVSESFHISPGIRPSRLVARRRAKVRATRFALSRIEKQPKSPSSSASRICLTIIRQTPCLSYNFSTGAALVARAPPMAATYPPPDGLHAQRSGRWPASGSRTPQHLTHLPGPNESATRIHRELLVSIRWRCVTYTG